MILGHCGFQGNGHLSLSCVEADRILLKFAGIFPNKNIKTTWMPFSPCNYFQYTKRTPINGIHPGCILSFPFVFLLFHRMEKIDAMKHKCLNQIRYSQIMFYQGQLAHKKSNHMLIANTHQKTVSLMLRNTLKMMDLNFSILQMSLLKPNEGPGLLYQGCRDSLNHRLRC